MESPSAQGDARKRQVHFADSVLDGSLAEVQEYEASECPQISPRTFDECCEEVLERMDFPDPAVRSGTLADVKGRVLYLAASWQGSQVVKKALEIARRDQQEGLIRELHGHVLELASSSVGSQVLQRCLQVLPANVAHFIFDEIKESALSVAQHETGCQVICKIIENLPVADTVALAKVLLDAPNGVCELRHNVCGQEVVKCFLDYGPESVQEFVRESLSSRSELQTQTFASCHRLCVHSQRAFPRDCELVM